MSTIKDIASCNCVSRKFEDSMRYIKSLFFPHSIFDNLKDGNTPDRIILQVVSSIIQLEELVVYFPFTDTGLTSWLSLMGSSLINLELRMDNLVDQNTDSPSKLGCIQSAKNLESLRLWGVQMVRAPKWDVFQKLKNLEIIGEKLEDSALVEALRATPNLTHLVILGREGLRTVWIELFQLEHCKLDFYGLRSCSLTLTAQKVEYIEVQLEFATPIA